MKCYTKRRLVNYVYYYQTDAGDDIKVIELDYLYSNKKALDYLKNVLQITNVKNIIGKNKIVRFYDVDNDVVKRYGKLLNEEIEML